MAGKSRKSKVDNLEVKNESKLGALLHEKWAQQVLFIAAIAIIGYFFMKNFHSIIDLFVKILGILAPIIVGFVLTYLLAPVYNYFVKLITKKRERYITDKTKLAKFAKSMATLICVIVVLLVTAGLVFLFVPQLYNSLYSFAGRASGYLSSLRNFVSKTKQDASLPIVRALLSFLEKAVQDLYAKSGDIKNIDMFKVVQGVYNGFSVSMKVVLNAFVGLIVMVYVLNMQVELCTGAKRIMFALCREDIGKNILAEVRFAHKVFSDFLVGKILDSVIIGILCYICCLIMQMPYTLLISVIVGVTNIIPFFGPFIGAIPSFLIIFLDQPLTWRPYGFLIFILILQQIDGNVIGPKILGDKTGVGSFWVLFSILLFGGLFGFVGMIIGVPLWAIISRLFDKFIVKRLEEKGQPLTVEEYARLKGYVEEVK